MPDHTTSALILAGVYAVSAFQKGRYLRPFEDYLRPLAGRFSRMAARLVVGTEVLLLLVLLLSVADNDLAGASGSSSLTFLALAVLAYSVLLARGRSTECHCFGTLPTSGSLNPAIRPALFALRSSILMTLSVSVRGANARDAAALSVAIVVAISAGLLFAIVRERLLLKRNPHPRVQEHAAYIGLRQTL